MGFTPVRGSKLEFKANHKRPAHTTVRSYRSSLEVTHPVGLFKAVVCRSKAFNY